MKRFAISSMLAGGLFAGLLGASGVAHADLRDVIWTTTNSSAPTSRTWTPVSRAAL